MENWIITNRWEYSLFVGCWRVHFGKTLKLTTLVNWKYHYHMLVSSECSIEFLLFVSSCCCPFVMSLRDIDILIVRAFDHKIFCLRSQKLLKLIIFQILRFSVNNFFPYKKFVNKHLKTKSLLTTPSNVLPLHRKQTFPPIIWIFTEGEGDGM